MSKIITSEIKVRKEIIERHNKFIQDHYDNLTIKGSEPKSTGL